MNNPINIALYKLVSGISVLEPTTKSGTIYHIKPQTLYKR